MKYAKAGVDNELKGIPGLKLAGAKKKKGPVMIRKPQQKTRTDVVAPSRLS